MWVVVVVVVGVGGGGVWVENTNTLNLKQHYFCILVSKLDSKDFTPVKLYKNVYN
jgi:hypothetical protein